MPDMRGPIEATAEGLDPRRGDGVIAKAGPLVSLVLYVGLVVLLSFNVLPDPAPVQALAGFLGPVVGIYVRHAGKL